MADKEVAVAMRALCDEAMERARWFIARGEHGAAVGVFIALSIELRAQVEAMRVEREGEGLG